MQHVFINYRDHLTFFFFFGLNLFILNSFNASILGMDPEKAMQQAIKSLDNYRSNLHDQWNFHGMTSSSHYGQDGLPWATSHYTLHLVLWHLPLALSGQQYYAPEGRMKFDPKYSPPYRLPFYTPKCIGSISAKEMSAEKDGDSEILYTVTVSSGLWIAFVTFDSVVEVQCFSNATPTCFVIAKYLS